MQEIIGSIVGWLAANPVIWGIPILSVGIGFFSGFMLRKLVRAFITIGLVILISTGALMIYAGFDLGAIVGSMFGKTSGWLAANPSFIINAFAALINAVVVLPLLGGLGLGFLVGWQKG